MGTQLPPLQKADGTPAQFSAHVYCGQTAGWIKMALGMEVDLGPGHIVLDGDHLPSPKRGTAPNFRPIFIVVKRLDIDQEGTWHGGGPWSRLYGARWGPSSPPQELGEGGRAPQFSPHFYCRQCAVCIKMPLAMEVGR